MLSKTTIGFLLLFFFFLISCNLQNTNELQKEEKIALNSQLSSDSVLSLKGVLNINSKGQFLFKSINHTKEGRGSATYLIPHNEELKTYVESHYDAYLHLRNLEKPFLVLIEGHYLTDNLVHSEDSTSFLFNFVALLDERELINEK